MERSRPANATKPARHRQKLPQTAIGDNAQPQMTIELQGDGWSPCSGICRKERHPMKTIITAFAIAFALISTSASAAFNGHDWADIISAILRPAPVVVVQPAPVVETVAPAITYVPNSNAAYITTVQPAPIVTWVIGADGKMVRPYDAQTGCSRSRLSDCTAEQIAAFGAETSDSDGVKQPEAAVVECTPVVVDNTDGRVCIKLDSGAVACGTYLGPQQ